MKNGRDLWTLRLTWLLLVLFLSLPCVFGQEDPIADPVSTGIAGINEIEDLVNIDFRSDIRIFTVMAALNVAGFDYELSDREMSSIRKNLRLELQDLDATLVTRLKLVYSKRESKDLLATHTAYTSLALVLTGPPDFSLTSNGPQVPADVLEIVEFEELLPQFYAAADLEQRWLRYRPLYNQELERYRPVFKSVIKDTLNYFRIPARIVLDRQIVLIPDPLGFSDVVHARNLERVYYVVVGPSTDPSRNFSQLQHEYLHFLVDPLVEKHGGEIMKSRDLLDLAQDQPYLSSDFWGRYILVVGESLIEALLWRFRPPEDPDRHQLTLFRRGLIFVPYFVRVLEEFERAEGETLPAYLEQVFRDISQNEIKNDAKAIAEIEARLDEEKKRAEEAEQQRRFEAEEREQTRQLLNAGIEFLVEGNLEEAKSSFSQLLERDPANAQVHFYLAQLEAQQNRHQDAHQLYRKVSANNDTPDWMRAWAIVRIGRYLAYRGAFAEARKEFQKVIQMEGDLKGAEVEARKLIDDLPEEDKNP